MKLMRGAGFAGSAEQRHASVLQQVSNAAFRCRYSVSFRGASCGNLVEMWKVWIEALFDYLMLFVLSNF